jgi:hypothetical protein
MEEFYGFHSEGDHINPALWSNVKFHEDQINLVTLLSRKMEILI